jgi:hypothetical protein
MFAVMRVYSPNVSRRSTVPYAADRCLDGACALAGEAISCRYVQPQDDMRVAPEIWFHSDWSNILLRFGTVGGIQEPILTVRKDCQPPGPKTRPMFQVQPLRCTGTQWQPHPLTTAYFIRFRQRIIPLAAGFTLTGMHRMPVTF